MDVNDLKGLYAESIKRMTVALDHLKHEFGGVRTGRASVTMLDGIQVDAYGSKMPLNQVAGLSVPEPALIVAQPFDPSQLAAIEKAIRGAGLGLNPANDGKVVRIPLPSLTEERRKELSKHVHKLTEDARNTIRGVRRDANDRLKKLLKDSKISEDDERKGLDEIQRITDNQVKLIDDAEKKKDAELPRGPHRVPPAHPTQKASATAIAAAPRRSGDSCRRTAWDRRPCRRTPR